MMAQHNLGAYYYNAKFVQKDISKALEWYLKAAEQGSGMSQHTIGLMYFNGDLPQDLEVALEWFKKSQENGYKKSEMYIQDIEQMLNKTYIEH
jgi:TPR repeat protein